MAATRSLNDSINWVKPFINWASVTIGVNSEPAITSANQALQTILAPPFIWPWNRSYTSFITSIGQQDYNTSIADFGYLEAASIELCGVITAAQVLNGVATYYAVNGFSTLPNQGQGQSVTIIGCSTSTLNGTFALASVSATSFTVTTTASNLNEVEFGAIAVAGLAMGLTLHWEALNEERATDRPTFISTQECDLSGTTFTFRLMPVPDQIYRVNLTYQKSPGAFAPSNLNATWGIPDQLQYIYNYFFLFFVLDYFDDPRAARYRQLAVASLLGRQSGLSETDRNLFLGNWLDIMQEEQSKQSSIAQGAQARGM
jgi:hypothetical protein